MAIPRERSRKATVNWLSLAITGTNGLPAAACQTWCSEESMCCAVCKRAIDDSGLVLTSDGREESRGDRLVVGRTSTW
ncbi:hypothetical protein V8C26DRAFT_214680 [Trichoderma gracile]